MADGEQTPRNFTLYRERDVSEVSGTGTVAWGTLFPDGSAVVRWCAQPGHNSTVVWEAPDALHSIETIHGHSGATKIIWSH